MQLEQRWETSGSGARCVSLGRPPHTPSHAPHWPASTTTGVLLLSLTVSLNCVHEPLASCMKNVYVYAQGWGGALWLLYGKSVAYCTKVRITIHLCLWPHPQLAHHPQKWNTALELEKVPHSWARAMRVWKTRVQNPLLSCKFYWRVLDKLKALTQLLSGWEQLHVRCPEFLGSNVGYINNIQFFHFCHVSLWQKLRTCMGDSHAVVCMEYTKPQGVPSPITPFHTFQGLALPRWLNAQIALKGCSLSNSNINSQIHKKIIAIKYSYYMLLDVKQLP